MSNLNPNQPSLHNAGKETVEDLEYVGSKISELVNTFNGLNSSKGFEIMSIKHNSVDGKIDVDMMTRHSKH